MPWPITCLYRRDPFPNRFPGTSCQATITPTPPGVPGRGSRLYKRQRKLARQFCREKERSGAHRLEDFEMLWPFTCFI